MARSVDQLVEEQMGRWRLARQLASTDDARPTGAFVHANVIAIVDAYGAGGAAIANMVGDQLRIPVYDHEIVEHIARTAKVRVETVELIDGRAYSAIDNYLTSLLHEKGFDQGDYRHALVRTVTALWAHGASVFVGHGVVNILPRIHQLAVRITAPKQVRVELVQEAEGLKRDEARRRVEHHDYEHEAFFHRLFRADVHDVQLFDLVLNRQWLDAEACAGIILQAFRHKFPQ